jgi:hypothetical protein
MSNDAIFYTQLGSGVVYVLTLFGIYRLLVEQKDSVIQLLKERLADKESKIQELESQTPDALTSALSSRIDVILKEVARLKTDGDKYQEEIAMKEEELRALSSRLADLSTLLQESNLSHLVCKKCGAPLSQRSCGTRSDYIDGREVEYEVEYTEYECGLAIQDGKEVSPCKGRR